MWKFNKKSIVNKINQISQQIKNKAHCKINDKNMKNKKNFKQKNNDLDIRRTMKIMISNKKFLIFF